jgi:hypothetical protein
MKKLLPIAIICILVINGFGALATTTDEQETITMAKITKTLNFDSSKVHVNDEETQYVEISLDGTIDYLMNPGQPMIPRSITNLELPFGATDIMVQAEVSIADIVTIAKKIVPSPSPLPLSHQDEFIVESTIDSSIYSSNDLYPHAWIGHHVGCGLNKDAKRVTFVTINTFPVRYRPLSGELVIVDQIEIEISYKIPEKDFFSTTVAADMVIITPSIFSDQAVRLAEHKNSFGVATYVKTTEEIYNEYSGVDPPEKIKYFIKDAIETEGITYVLLFGGLKNQIFNKPKDNRNHGSTWWHIPVRYSNFNYDGGPGYNFTSGEPGYIADLYYADVYKEGGFFEDWDPNGNGIFAEWSGDIVRDEIDMYPDVALGRLAVRSGYEANVVVTKIINYEKQPADPSWFKRIISISGDGFLDQEDWNILWDTKTVPDGEYTIYAQSSNPDNDLGPIDEIQVTLDKNVETNITFNHDDHLKEELQDGYPAPPIAEIMTISNGNTLGNTNYTFKPSDSQAYCNDLYWYANVSYVNEVLTIRGKSYDPQPYGNLTDIHLWIENDIGTTVFTAHRNDTETYYEGEWVVGEKLLRGRGGALAYMPTDWDTNSVFTSNGKWVTQDDVIAEFSEGYGLAYFSGHGSPGWWGDHYPGIPGNRRHGQVAGLVVTQLSPYPPYIHFPMFPMRQLTNTDKLPVVAVGGCHNSQFNISVIPSIMNRFKQNWMNTYGTPIPQCWGWYMVKLPKTGAIATMGNTGYGWGSEGDVCTIGTGDAWINTEFFRQYGEEDQEILGMAYSQSISSYISHHMAFELEYWRHDYGWDGIDQKTVEQWVLLGDPSLMIGGYP